MDEKNTNQQLLQIGEFSRLSKVSVRMLRHYQLRELLTPAWIDPFKGYRYYNGNQLLTAQRIRQLRDIGMKIDDIQKMLMAADDPTEWQKLLEAHRWKVLAESKVIAAQLQAIDNLLDEKGSAIMKFIVENTMLPAMETISVRATLDDYEQEGVLWERMGEQFQIQGLSWEPNAICGALFHDPDYRESEVDVEIWTQCNNGTSVQPPLHLSHWDDLNIIRTTLTGPYDGMYQASDALANYAVENGLDTGNMFNIYLVGPATEADPMKWVTQVCAPIISSK